MIALLLVLLAPPPAADSYAVDAVRRLLAVHGYDRPQRDRTLNEAARELAAHHVEAQPKDAQQAAALLRFVLAKHSIADTHVVPFTLRHAQLSDLDAHLPRLVARLEQRQAPTHVGASTRAQGEGQVTTLLLVHRAVALEAPLPQRLDSGESLRLSGPLLRGYFQPRVLVSPPGAAPVRELPAWTGGRRIDALVKFDAGPGAYDVEIVADSPEGPVVLVNQRIYAGVRPPSRAQPSAPEEPAGDPARALFQQINAAREAAGLNRLRWHPGLVQAATAHASEMAAARSLRHVSPEHGPLTARLKAIGLRPTAVAENLALADNASVALAAFMDSPGHKRNLYLTPLSHIGVGVSGRYFAVALAKLPW